MFSCSVARPIGQIVHCLLAKEELRGGGSLEGAVVIWVGVSRWAIVVSLLLLRRRRWLSRFLSDRGTYPGGGIVVDWEVGHHVFWEAPL